MTTYRAWNLKPLDRSALKELTAAIAQQSTEELESRAMETMDGEPWSEEKYQMTLAAQQKEAGLLAGILAARGITDPAEALTLLSGEEELTDPMLLTDMDKACARFGVFCTGARIFVDQPPLNPFLKDAGKHGLVSNDAVVVQLPVLFGTLHKRL